MIRALRFFDEKVVGGRRIREGYFKPVSSVKLDVVCDVANSARERMSELFDCGLNVELFDPVAVPRESRATLFKDATVFVAHGMSSDLLVIFRARDARRIVACAFREEEPPADVTLSSMEARILERIAREIAELSVALCGPLVSFARANARLEQYECATYFELRFSSPLEAIIGIALTKDPLVSTSEKLNEAAFDGITLPLRVCAAHGSMRATQLAELAVGSVVTFDTRIGERATLMAERITVAHGDCGEQGGNVAFRLGDPLGKTLT